MKDPCQLFCSEDLPSMNPISREDEEAGEKKEQ